MIFRFSFVFHSSSRRCLNCRREAARFFPVYLHCERVDSIFLQMDSGLIEKLIAEQAPLSVRQRKPQVWLLSVPCAQSHAADEVRDTMKISDHQERPRFQATHSSGQHRPHTAEISSTKTPCACRTRSSSSTRSTNPMATDDKLNC